jgi:hypothetical protein
VLSLAGELWLSLVMAFVTAAAIFTTVLLVSMSPVAFLDMSSVADIDIKDTVSRFNCLRVVLSIPKTSPLRVLDVSLTLVFFLSVEL